MKAADVKINGEYEMRVGKETIQVRILAEKAGGGWTAQNLATKKKVFVSLARLLKEPEAQASTTTEDNLTIVEVPLATVETINGTSTKPKRGRKPKTETVASEGKTSLSQLDAAAKVLSEATEPMTTKEMVETMSARGYWSSPGGKTPHATLYSSILRELQSKGESSRFIKTERGHFKLRTA